MSRLRQKTIVLVIASSSFLLNVNAWALAKNNGSTNANRIANDTNYIDTNPVVLYQKHQYDEAAKKWQQILVLTGNLDEKALIYSNLGNAYRQMGKTSEAIAQWQQAISIYQAQNQSHNSDRLSKLLIDQAQAYVAIGQPQQAILLLQKISLGTENLYLAKGALGNAYLALGKYESAIAAYQESISLTDKPQTLASGWMNLGNAFTKSAERHYRQIQVETEEGNRIEVTRLQKLRDQEIVSAHSAYTRSLEQNAQVLIKSQALLNLAHLVQDTNLQNRDDQKFASYLQQAASFAAIAPLSRSKIYALIDLAALHQKYSPILQIQFLEQARTLAQSIGDQRGESLVMGAIGRVYEVQGDFELALSYTSQAQWLAQAINSADSLYRWQWQSGRILKSRGERSKAIETYRQAIATLQSIRSDIVAADRNFQFDVRDLVEPIYRELLELLLSESSSHNSQPMLEESLQVSQLLRLSELQNFFGDECLEARSIPKISQEFSQQKAALIYSIILDKQTYIVMRLPDGSLKSYVIPLSKTELSTKIKYLRLTLENVATNEYLNPTQEIYDLLIRPMEPDLKRSQVELLVFVNDGILRSVPMAALYDGNQFLIQKYPIIYLVGSKLTDTSTINSSANSSAPSKLDLVAFGLSEAIAPFAAIPNVFEELKEIEKIWKLKTNGKNEAKLFLNRDFTFEALQAQVKQGYGIVHLATHAKFGSTPESTFLQAFDRKINLDQLESILRSSKSQIELLVLSACQTAAGDNRATLGLAGVALRSGVKNVLATLWAVDDTDVVVLIKDFYRESQINGVTKAQALQKAQIKSITKDNLHPASWSAFILVGN
jgi:CHAT domain-containing protein